MGNHLHDLILSIEENGPIFFDHMTDEQMDHVSSMAIRASTESMCFDAGEIDGFGGMKVIDDLVRLPYQKCWIEMNHGDGVVIGHLMLEYEGVINAQAWRKMNGCWRYLFGWENSLKGKTRIGHFHPSMSESAMQTIVACARIFLSALNCSNINRIEHKPSEKLQKARAKRGKKPLFSYWTLEIDLPKSRAVGEDYGGTHAAPRLHLRRGHPRQYAPGKYCWVQPHVVGNKAAGMVHKDYAAKYAHA